MVGGVRWDGNPSVLDGRVDGEAPPHPHALLPVYEERVDFEPQVRLEVALRVEQLLVLRLGLLQLPSWIAFSSARRVSCSRLVSASMFSSSVATSLRQKVVSVMRSPRRRPDSRCATAVFSSVSLLRNNPKALPFQQVHGNCMKTLSTRAKPDSECL
ncbi:Peptidyl-lysine N-acetyltransferase Pat [Frankliniella fusca]|uniref:Peptidyl-lysine N-acetyltransferase Pat n=1 Tax=Frankliniella fusca TaxID=407009 RepID=A0AAE1H4V4_9NEOP|nr:Peptidyl-lysine N-acetyltransferase Pat [Frankliniella fusca]